MQKPPVFIKISKVLRTSYIFTKIWDLEIFDNETTAILKSVKWKKKLNSPNFSNITKGTLIVKDCDIAIYPCSNYGPSNLLFPLNSFCKVLDLKSLWKSMKLWELLISLMKTAGFFMRSLAKAVRNHQSEQMKNWKQAF